MTDTRRRGAQIADAEAQTRAWEAIKAEERAGRGEPPDDSVLAGISRGLPEWTRALKLQQRAATMGFDWPSAGPVLDKLAEELAELRAEFARGSAPDRLEDELGDILFVVVNLARHAKVDFSRALRHANGKFERRFRSMERLAQGHLAELDLAAQEVLWQSAKQQER